jgi:hypothetical protein
MLFQPFLQQVPANLSKMILYKSKINNKGSIKYKPICNQVLRLLLVSFPFYMGQIQNSISILHSYKHFLCPHAHHKGCKESVAGRNFSHAEYEGHKLKEMGINL